MFAQKINRSDPEKVFISVYQSYATATVVRGTPVVWDLGTDCDGVSITLATTALSLRSAAGIVEPADIAAGAYGLVQCYGINTNARVYGAAAVAKGDSFKIANGETRLTRITATSAPAATSTSMFIAAYASSTTTGTLTGKSVFIRCM